MIKTFRELIVWQKSMQLVTNIYRLSQAFPREERYGLTNQLRRSAVSVPSNIAEGFGRQTTKDYLRFLQIAMGSLFEFQTQLEIAKNLEFLSRTDFDSTFEASRELERMLSSLIRKLKSKEQSGKGS